VLDLRAVGAGHPDAVALNVAVQDHYRVVYGDGDGTPLSPGQFDPPHGLYLVGYDGGRPVVSGAWRAVDADPSGSGVLRPGDAEIKRMYVVPEARGRGYARTLLAEIERTALAAGRTRTVLETGDAQPEAIALYTSSGYEPIPRFGLYRDDERSRCFAKLLEPAG